MRSRSAQPAPDASAEPTSSPQDFDGRFDTRGRSLRSHTARGSVINAVFVVGVNSLGVLKGFVVAAFLSASEYGTWGILFITFATLLWLKQVGIGDKYIQQSEEDQELAFQKAFTLELLSSGVFLALLLTALPLAALVYGQPQMVAPGLLLATAVPAAVLSTPIWVYYRRMEFARQRVLQAADPLVSFVVTVALAVAGAGYWSLVVGVVAGAWAGAIVAIAFSPYRLALRYDRRAVKEYLSFSGPLFLAGLSSMGIAQGSMLVGEAAVGLAAAGAIALASSITTYADRIDQIITQTLYPAICAVQERTELLFEAFVKSNRLALIWSVPFGLSLTLFGPDLVEFGLGEEWEPAVLLLQVFGVNTALFQVGFNWHAFFRARGETRPMAVVAFGTFVGFAASVVPLTILEGLDGFAAGMAVMTLVNFLLRMFFLSRLFPSFGMMRHLLRAFAPSIPAVVTVVGMRVVESGDRTLGLAWFELVAYVVVTVVATLYFERDLLREVRGYLTRRAPLLPEATA